VDAAKAAHAAAGVSASLTQALQGDLETAAAEAAHVWERCRACRAPRGWSLRPLTLRTLLWQTCAVCVHAGTRLARVLLALCASLQARRCSGVANGCFAYPSDAKLLS